MKQEDSDNTAVLFLLDSELLGLCICLQQENGRMRAALVIGIFCAGLAMSAGNLRADEHLSLVFVGDTGLNASGARVSSEGGYKAGYLLSVDGSLEPMRPWLKADLVFANLETVVTDNNMIASRDKMFVFRMHPAGARALVSAGINVFSTANNHAMDFGIAGAGETLKNMEALRGQGLLAWPGIGRSEREALMPQLFSVGDTKIAISAFGIGGGGLPAREGNAGSLRGEENFKQLTDELAQAPADLRILSVHYGMEFAPVVTTTEAARFENLPDGIDIVVGHHAHVARGAAITDGRLILYGLGNFLHFGTQNMARFDICRDFGLLAKVGMMRATDGSMSLETVEAVPLTNMHKQTRPMAGDAAKLRIAVLNYLGARLDDKARGTQGLHFATQPDGTGLWCAKGAVDPRCEGWILPPPTTGKADEAIKSACARNVRRGG